MKWIVFFVLTAVLAVPAFGQSTEFSIRLNSGLFRFGGESAVSSSFLNVSDTPPSSTYTNSPYGRGIGLSYGLAAHLQRVTKSGFLFGIQVGYESLSSRVKLDNAWGEINWTLTNGRTILRHQFINFYPFFGKRITVFKDIETDLTLGFDVGVCLQSREHATAVTDRIGTVRTSADRSKPNPDIRPRFELTNY